MRDADEWFPEDGVVTRGRGTIPLCDADERFPKDGVVTRGHGTVPLCDADERFPKDGVVTRGGRGTVPLCGTRFKRGVTTFDVTGTSRTVNYEQHQTTLESIKWYIHWNLDQQRNY